MVERFSPLDANGLLYRFTVYDPHHAAPYSGELPWPKTDASLYEYACHEGNYSMANTLRGARHQERATTANRRRRLVRRLCACPQYKTLGSQVARLGSATSAPIKPICSTTNGTTPR